METFGIERERFITNKNNEIVTEIGILLPKVIEVARSRLIDESRFTYELYAGQIEDRTTVCSGLRDLRESLIENDSILEEAASSFGLSYECSEYVDRIRLTDLKPNPFNSRHQTIFKNISLDQKIAASQVAAVHIHIGVNKDDVVRCLNVDRIELDNLIKLGDHSNGKRIKSYSTMAGTQQFPPLFDSIEEVMRYIESKGGEKNVYDLIRYKPSTSTIEFRMFGITDNIDEIINYAIECKRLTKGR
jgi:gamma-glutamyl:cysteine ligase YbdK (ATP-grasp superfamily)